MQPLSITQGVYSIKIYYFKINRKQISLDTDTTINTDNNK